MGSSYAIQDHATAAAAEGEEEVEEEEGQKRRRREYFDWFDLLVAARLNICRSICIYTHVIRDSWVHREGGRRFESGDRKRRRTFYVRPHNQELTAKKGGGGKKRGKTAKRCVVTRNVQKALAFANRDSACCRVKPVFSSYCYVEEINWKRIWTRLAHIINVFLFKF